VTAAVLAGTCCTCRNAWYPWRRGVAILTHAGFAEVMATPIVAEAGLITVLRPAARTTSRMAWSRQNGAADMSSRNGSIRPGGFTVLGLAAVAGVALGVHGWSTPHTPAALGSIGAGAANARARPGTSAGPPARPSSSPSSPASAQGPPLNAQSYAQYAFQVWPGRLSPAGQAAEIGLAITVRRQSNGLAVSAGVNGQPASAPHFYPAGALVYVIEASLGDDSGASDYNLGDDGIVVTDAHGRIVQ
jgi:hypothetical protein